MFCGKCKNDLQQCTCPDLKERLDQIAGVMALPWCQKCRQWAYICRCEKPEIVVRMPQRANKQNY